MWLAVCFVMRLGPTEVPARLTLGAGVYGRADYITRPAGLQAAAMGATVQQHGSDPMAQFLRCD